MGKKVQSKSLRLKNTEYRKFVNAYRDSDYDELRKGYKKGYRIGNKVFLDELSNEMNEIQLGSFLTMSPKNAIKYLNKTYINQPMEGNFTLLDMVVRIFTDAIDLTSNNQEANKYIYFLYISYLIELGSKGAVLNHAPVYPENALSEDNPYSKEILNILEHLDPNKLQEESEEEESEEEDSDEY
jgi:hypothetical protein